jgi:hypothetical protein
MSSGISGNSENSLGLLQDTADATVSVHALSCGHFTLPEYQFVHPVSRDARKSVPSLAFLIQHQDLSTGKVVRIVFDLGLRRDIKKYAVPIQKHVETRQPMTTDPDVTKSLARGGLVPADIDYVVYSHVRLWAAFSTNPVLSEIRYIGIILASLVTSLRQHSLLATAH